MDIKKVVPLTSKQLEEYEFLQKELQRTREEHNAAEINFRKFESELLNDLTDFPVSSTVAYNISRLVLKVCNGQAVIGYERYF